MYSFSSLQSQALEQCTELGLAELRRIRERLLAALAPPALRPQWQQVSHVSGASFFENKHGFPAAAASAAAAGAAYAHVDCDVLLRPLFNSADRQQRRGIVTDQRRYFKTNRSERVTRLSGEADDETTTTTTKIQMLGQLTGLTSAAKDAKATGTLLKSVDKNAKLKQILEAAESLSPQQKEKIKVAFAEGYMVGNDKSRAGSSKVRTFNMIRDIMGIILIVALLGTFVGGPFRKVLIGNGNEVHPEDIDVCFDDVKGVDEAKQELEEIVDFLRYPEKYSRLGAKLPKGVLLVGPPGTGKTLLARAVAGEAGVPFFHSAGAEFDEILVGQGARRVRDLFSTAKARAPCVIFIDEIDSVGAKRTSSMLHPYANQTINQLLAEMDGFRQNEGVIVLGATNRREDLDKALLRPGRFDVEVQVPVPDMKGRKEIMELYLGKVKLGDDIDMDVLSRGTTGFTGADLENMVNQAALRAAIDGLEAVPMEYLESARDKVLMGPERKSRIPDDDANKITAYHEGGHAIVSYYTKDSMPLHKVTIIPRGASLGHTAYMPEKEYSHTKKSQLLAMLDTLMGGRVAEEMVYGPENVTSGAADDLRKATEVVKLMVKEWGMSDKVGVRTFEEQKNVLLGASAPDVSASTQELIDSEMKRLLAESYERARHILSRHAREHRNLADALLRYETLDFDEIKLAIEGGDLTERKRKVAAAKS